MIEAVEEKLKFAKKFAKLFQISNAAKIFKEKLIISSPSGNIVNVWKFLIDDKTTKSSAEIFRSYDN